MSATKVDAAPSTAEHTSASSAAPVPVAPIGLVQQLGNQGLQALLRARLMQAKLAVSHPQDGYEQEADRVAEQVMRMPLPTAAAPIDAIQRLPDRRELHRFADAAAEVPTVDAATEQSIQSLSGRGSALPDSVRTFMEPRFGADFSAVRVHTDAHAHGLARSVNAQAFTVGRNLVFGAGHYAPDTENGKRLLAHELTHTIQQGSASRVVQRSPETAGNRALALPSSLQALFEESKRPTLEQLADGTVDIKSLGPAELRDVLAEIEQYRDRQISTSFKGIRIDDLRTAVIRALGKTETDIALADDSLRGGKARKKKQVKPHPTTSPRILQYQSSSVLYSNPAELRAEYDLIVEWLKSTDVTKKDRHTLELERENLEGMLSIDRQHASDERHMKLVQAALAMKDDSNVAAALLSLARTIEGISTDPEDDRIRYLYFQGERLAISAEQAGKLQKGMETQLVQAAFQILHATGGELDRFKARIEWNSDHWFRASWAEIFEGHVFSSIHDPINEVLERFPRVTEGLRALQEHARAGRFVDAAAKLPEMEQLFLEIQKDVETYIHDYEEGEARAATTLKITAAVVAAVAVGVAAVALTPMVGGYIAGAVGAQGLGWTGIGGAAVTAVGTVVVTGTAIGLGSGALHAGATFGWSLAAGDSLAEAWASSKEEAVKGFVDGFVAGAGGGAARVLGKALGVGSSIAFQRARRAGTEAIVNGTTTLVDTLARGGTLEQAIKAAGRSAVLAVPGSLIGAGNVKKLIAGTMSAAGTAYLGAYYNDPQRDRARALQASLTAVVTHVVTSRLGHDPEIESRAAKIGAQHGSAVKTGAVNFTVAAAIHTANMLPRESFGGPRSGARDDIAVTARGPESERTPTPDSVVNEEGNAQTRAESAELDSSGPARQNKDSVVGLTEQDLQHLAAEALRRPINDPGGKVHIYPTVEAFETAYRRLSPDGRPTRAFFNRDTGEIHLAPNAKIKSGIHEMTHSVRETENQWGRDYIGDFLDEGVTDAIAIEHTGQNVNRSGYRKNIAFYQVLKAALGGSPAIEQAIVHGQYGALRAKVRQLFGGSELRTFEFFNKLRSIGANAQNPVALDEAVAMLEQASGKSAAELSGWQAPEAAGASSSAGSIEKVGPFSLVGAKASVERPGQGKVLSRRIGALIRSGVPIADADIRPLMGHLLSNARAAGATRLRIVPEFLTGLNAPSLTTVVENLGGTIRPIGSAFEIDIPVTRRRPTGTATPRQADIDGSTEARGSRSSRVDLSESDDDSGGRGDDGATTGKAARVPNAGSIQEMIDEAATMVRALDEGHPLRRDLERFIKEANTSDGAVGKAIRAGGDRAARARREVQRLATNLAEIKRIYPDDLLQAIANGEGPTRIDAIPLGGTAEARSDLTVRSSGPETKDQIAVGEISHSEPAAEPALPDEQPSVVLGDDLEASKGGSSERNTMDSGNGGRRNPSDSDPLPPVPRTGRTSPERLFELLEKGGSRKLTQATVAGQAQKPKPGVFRRGLTNPNAAYRAFNKAIARSAGHEVGIFYNTETGEYAVIIDSPVKVSAPENERGWIGLVHFHHNEFNSWVLRLPSPRSDFSDLWARTRSENARVREFIEWNDPNGGRGRTELGIDLAWPDKPIYVRIVEPNGKQWIERFRTEAEYQRYYDNHTKFVEPGSELHNWVVSSARGGGDPGTRRAAMDPPDGGRGATSSRTAPVASAGSIQELIDEAATMAHALDEGHPLRRDLRNFIAEANTSDRWVSRAIRAGGDEATPARHEVGRLANDLAEIKRLYPNDLLQAIARGEGPTRIDAVPLGGTSEVRPGLRIRSSGTEAEISGGNIPHREAAPDRAPPADQPSVVLGDGLEAEQAPAARNDFSDNIPTRDIKPTSERHFLESIVAQARARLSSVLGKLDAREGVAPGEEHLSPECMSGHCGLSRRTVARALKEAGIPDERIFMNDSSKVAGTGAHTFTIVEIAPGRYILIDATFAQFTGMLDDAPRVGETILRKSGQLGAHIRSELLEKGYLVLNDEIANTYMKVVSESERGAYKVQDLVRDQARLDRNPELLVGF